MSVKTRGFGNPKLSQEARHAFATKGGKQVQKDGTGHRWTKGSEEAKEASRRAVDGRARAKAKRLAAQEHKG